MTAFDQHPGFYQEDARKKRLYNPITKKTLITKFERLLPEEFIKGKKVLDLGCCLGAAGQWTLHYGASHYTGVEVQTDFVKKATNLLSHWGESATIIEQDIRSYLEQCHDQEFDIVIAAGVLQVFDDPQNIITHCSRVAKEMISVEAILPPLVRSGKVAPNVKIMQLCKTSSNFAGGDHKINGYGTLLSKPALDFLFFKHGFNKSAWSLMPSYSEDTKAFSIPLEGEVVPFRFFERYTAFSPPNQEITLESAVISGEGEIEQWTESQFSSTQEHSTNNIAWTFNQDVAEKFTSIAKTHIPNYDMVIDLSIDTIKQFNFDTPNIIDVGCATGETLIRLKNAGYDNLTGVDNSQAMLSIAAKKIPDANFIYSESFPSDEQNYDVVIANWTLHFIGKRRQYLQNIYDNLNPGGILILTEKTSFSDATKKLYYNFKRKQGVSEDEIQQKEIRLQGVLNTASPGWYIDALTDIGFESCDIISAQYGFVTFLAQKH